MSHKCKSILGKIRLFRNKMLIKKYIPYLILLLGQTAIAHSLFCAQDSIPNNSAIACALDRMNVLYIGVENPITIAVSNTSPDKVTVLGQGCTVTPKGNGKFSVTATTQGIATIQVSGNGNTQIFRFRVKLIPNPVPTFSGKKRGEAAEEPLCIQTGLISIIENFDFEVKCVIQSYTVTHIPRHEAPTSMSALGGAFDEKVRQFICAGKPGDMFRFSNIKTLCPGDAIARDIGDVVYFVN
jgi:hypothetical protein